MEELKVLEEINEKIEEVRNERRELIERVEELINKVGIKYLYEDYRRDRKIITDNFFEYIKSQFENPYKIEIITKKRKKKKKKVLRNCLWALCNKLVVHRSYGKYHFDYLLEWQCHEPLFDTLKDLDLNYKEWQSIRKALLLLEKYIPQYLILKRKELLTKLTKCEVKDGKNPCVKVCERCGYENEINAKYCSECGGKF